jgi:Ca2+-binding EF-hand superfamily protein
VQARFSAAKALSHPWISQDGIASDAPLDVRVIQNMSRFAGYNRVKKAILVEIAKTFKETEIADLRKQFAVMDADNSGTISIDEMVQAMTSFKTGENGKPVFSAEDIQQVFS